MSCRTVLVTVVELELSDFAVPDAQDGCEITQNGVVFAAKMPDNVTILGCIVNA
mgnify:CR=1 FL=1